VYCRAGILLANLAEWLNKPECPHLAPRLLKKAEAITSAPLEKHDVFQVMVVVNDRKKHPTFLDAAMLACQKPIKIASEVMRLWRSELQDSTHHNGFEQLTIIPEKEGDYAAAIRLSREATKQRWRAAHWEWRIHAGRVKLAREG